MAFGLFSNERRAANERMEDDNLSALLNSKLRINKRRRKKNSRLNTRRAAHQLVELLKGIRVLAE